MTPPPDEHPRALLGAFVLGHLPPHEATAVGAHLDGCALCREEVDALGSVAAMLPLADPARLGAPAEPPEGMLDGVLLRIEQQRETSRARRRSLAVRGGVAAAVAALALVLVVALQPSSEGDGSVVVMAANVSGVQGEAVVHDDPDATWVELTTSGLSAGETYAVWFEETGTRERAPLGTFTAVEGDLYISLYSTLPRDRAASIGVSTPDGATVMEGTVPDVAAS